MTAPASKACDLARELPPYGETPPRGFSLRSPRLAFACLLVVLLASLFTVMVFITVPMPMAVLGLALPLAFIIVIYPLRLLVHNVLCLAFAVNRKVMLGAPVNTNTYRNTFLGQRIGSGDKVTILIPVYTEAFEVIKRTIQSALSEAMHTGANVNVVVCDDSLMYFANNEAPRRLCTTLREVAPRERSDHQHRLLERIDYYDELLRRRDVNFACVARPWPISGVPCTARAGAFKKAGNLNFAHRLYDRSVALGAVDEKTLGAALGEMLGEYASCAYVRGDLFIGDFIVLLDKDSTIPRGAIDEMVPDFHDDPSLSFLQSAIKAENSGENGFAALTAYFYEQEFSVKYAMEAVNKSVSLVGHNAIIRTSHLRGLRYWSEEYVSEDLSLAMALSARGYHGKYVDLKEMRFGECAPNTLREEAQRYSRYAYGAAQLVFKPFDRWLSDGPVQTDFARYVRSPHLPWYCKVDVGLHLASFVSMSLLVPAILLSVFVPQLISTIHPFALLCFFCASLTKVIPAAYFSSDVFGKSRGFWWGFGRYVGFSLPKVVVDLFLFFTVGRGWFAYLAGIRSTHAPTNVNEFVAVPIEEAVKEVMAVSRPLLGFVMLFIALVSVAQLAGVQELSFPSYLFAITMLLLCAPTLLSSELRSAVLRRST